MNARSGALAGAMRPSASGTLGLSLHLWWGDQRVGEYFLPAGQPRAFSVGSVEGVDFALKGPRFELVRCDADGFVLRFSRQMTGTLERGERATPLEELELDWGPDGACELALEPGDRALLDVGGIHLEASFARVSRVAAPKLTDSVDYTVLNAFLAVLFVFALGIISFTARDPSADPSDDLAGAAGTVRQILIHQAPPAAVRPPALVAPRADRPEAAAAHSGAEGKAGKPKGPPVDARAANKGPPSPNRGRELAQRLFGPGGAVSLQAVLAGIGPGGDFQAAAGHVTGRVVGTADGMWGMGLRGLGPGGGGLDGVETIGIQLKTHGRGDPLGNGHGDPGLSPGEHPDPKIDPPTLFGCGTDTGMPCLDKELIRKVIHKNRQQLRYCYELALTQNPRLSGKLAVAFTIAAQGKVSAASVASSDLHNSTLESCVLIRLEQWVFPRVPAGWVKVTYPFVFQPSGE